MDPLVDGDPEAMRALAAGLRSRAERVAAGSTRVQARAGTLTYEGPAARRFRDATTDRHRRAMSVAAQLQDLANHVLRRANEVEDTQLAEQATTTEEAPGCD